jgi:hypothetical protein
VRSMFLLGSPLVLLLGFDASGVEICFPESQVRKRVDQERRGESYRLDRSNSNYSSSTMSPVSNITTSHLLNKSKAALKRVADLRLIPKDRRSQNFLYCHVARQRIQSRTFWEVEREA